MSNSFKLRVKKASRDMATFCTFCKFLDAPEGGCSDCPVMQASHSRDEARQTAYENENARGR